MKLNHINLPVTDIAASQEFYAKYFGMKTVMMERGRNVITMMRDDSGLLLVLSHFDKSAEIQYPKDFHIGFFFETREEVNQVHAQMTSDGLEAEAPKRMAGRWVFYIQGLGGVTTEVACLDGGDW